MAAGSIRRTLLFVCEGYADECFLKHLRSLYLDRQGDTNLRVRNARGKGGRFVLSVALKPQVRRGFDSVAVLVDTDTDWDGVQRRRAQAEGLAVFESRPCLEAFLLAIHGESSGQRSPECKRAFKKRFGSEAHDPRVYDSYFTLATLQQARNRLPELHRLIRLIERK